MGSTHPVGKLPNEDVSASKTTDIESVSSVYTQSRSNCFPLTNGSSCSWDAVCLWLTPAVGNEHGSAGDHASTKYITYTDTWSDALKQGRKGLRGGFLLGPTRRFPPCAGQRNCYRTDPFVTSICFLSRGFRTSVKVMHESRTCFK
jgi:hypothetical protein